MIAAAGELLYFVFVFLFGVYTSLRIGCGRPADRFGRVFAWLCPCLLLGQGLCLQWLGLTGVRMLYPLLVHLPLVLALALWMKVRWDTALVSMLVSYSLCQLLRWMGLAIGLAFESTAASFIHLAVSMLLAAAISRFCLNTLHELISGPVKMTLSFGALPALYYAYDYFQLYTGRRFANLLVLEELLPTAMVLFYALFAMVYQRQADRYRQSRLQAQALEKELSGAAHELSVLRLSAEQTAIVRHDLRHHLVMIEQMLSDGRRDSAEAYIRKAESEVDAITPNRFCENEAVSLILSSFASKARQQQIDLHIKAQLPPQLSLPDTEICVLLSNGLENAFHAVSALENKTVNVYCAVRQKNLLVEIKNPCTKPVEIRDGLPRTNDGEPHYGCLSIANIVQRRKGLCTFEQEDGWFVLRVAVPLER